jgi:hypothetical protein
MNYIRKTLIPTLLILGFTAYLFWDFNDRYPLHMPLQPRTTLTTIAIVCACATWALSRFFNRKRDDTMKNYIIKTLIPALPLMLFTVYLTWIFNYQYPLHLPPQPNTTIPTIAFVAACFGWTLSRFFNRKRDE